MIRITKVLLISFLFQSCQTEREISFIFPISYNLNVFTDFISLKNYHPKSVQWIINHAPCIDNSRLPCPNDYNIQAHLFFAKDELEQLKLEYEQSKLPNDGCNVNFNFKWLNKSIKSKIKKGENPCYRLSFFKDYYIGNFIIISEEEILISYSKI